MIAIDLVIDKITKSSGGATEIDYMIALVMGWKRIEKQGASGGAGKSTMSWINAFGEYEAKVPGYTRNLQEAYSLASQVAPSASAGCGWEAGQASAQIVGQPPFLALTPQLALCGAAMSLKKQQMNGVP